MISYMYPCEVPSFTIDIKKNVSRNSHVLFIILFILTLVLLTLAYLLMMNIAILSSGWHRRTNQHDVGSKFMFSVQCAVCRLVKKIEVKSLKT